LNYRCYVTLGNVAIEHFVVLRYMTEQAPVGLWTTLVSTPPRHQHMMFWCSIASAQHIRLAMFGIRVCLT